MNNEIIHDFRPDKLRWGWNGLDFNVNEDRKTALMKGVGKGIQSGHYIVLTQGGQDYAYLVELIDYETNPTDLFNANLRIVGLIEE